MKRFWLLHLGLLTQVYPVQANALNINDMLGEHATATAQQVAYTEAPEALLTADNSANDTHILLTPPPPRPSNNGLVSNTIAPGPSALVPNHLSGMSPAQTQQMLQQAQNLTPDQMQAIAKSYQQQNGAPNNLGAGANSALSNNNAGPSSSGASHPNMHSSGASSSGNGPQLMNNVGTNTTFSGHPNIANSPGNNPGNAAPPDVPVGAPTDESVSIEAMRRDTAFSMLMQEVLPLSPDQITKLHHFYDLTLQAKATTPNPPPAPHFTSTVVSLEPGSMPPVIRLAAGFVTSLIFVDSTGASWPLTAYSIGDPQNFNIQWDQKGNAIFIQSLKQYAHGNLAVRLWGLDTPVMITLVAGQRNVDFRVDLQVLGRGPDAKPAVVDTTFNAKVNPILINLLDGVPPRGSIKLGITGGSGDAWLADSRVYFRTKLTVLSPAWTATVTSPDGTHVYELMLTPSILASQNGKTIDIKLSGL